MIKVLEHGKYKMPINHRCNNCSCLFSYSIDDVVIRSTGEYKPNPRFDWADSIEIFDKIICCPECNTKIVLEHDIF